MVPNLPLSAFRLDFRLDAPLALPRYAGSAWRGAFGHALKRTVCVVRDTPCAACMLYRSCVYPAIFETPPPADSAMLKKYPAAPHPYVLTLESAAEEASYRLGFTLVGKAHQSLPYCLHAFTQAGERGIGAKRQTFKLTRVQQSCGPDLHDWQTVHEAGRALSPLAPVVPQVPPCPQSVRVVLDTPLRLRVKEQYVTPEQFHFADLFGHLLRRISLLSYFHTDRPLEADFKGLSTRARAVELADRRLHWQDWTRYSSRQQATMEMGGLLGSFGLAGAELAEFWPYLWLGQWTHVGKATTMGLGRYRLVAASLPERTGAE